MLPVAAPLADIARGYARWQISAPIPTALRIGARIALYAFVAIMPALATP